MLKSEQEEDCLQNLSSVFCVECRIRLGDKKKLGAINLKFVLFVREVAERIALIPPR